MLRVQARTTVPALDLRWLLALLPAWLRRWREVRFEDGVVVDGTGRRREGLRVEAGHHPRPGTRYRLVTVAEDGQVGTLLAELLADDSSRVVARWRNPDTGEAGEAEVSRPDRPSRLVASGTVPVRGGRLTRGEVRIDGDLDLAALPAAGAALPAAGAALPAARRPAGTGLPTGDGAEPQLVVTAGHRRGTVTVRARIDPAPEGTWSVALEVAAAGRGIARPVVAAMSPFVRRMVARELDTVMSRLGASVADLDRELRALSGPDADPDRAAAELVGELLAGVP